MGQTEVVGPVESILYLLALVATVSLVARLRLATGVERQQIKWLTYAGAVLAGSAGLYFVVSEATDVRWFGWFSHVLEMMGIVGLPVVMGIAIFRYRLHNIDLLINRTLVYAQARPCLSSCM